MVRNTELARATYFEVGSKFSGDSTRCVSCLFVIIDVHAMRTKLAWVRSYGALRLLVMFLSLLFLLLVIFHPRTGHLIFRLYTTGYSSITSDESYEKKLVRAFPLYSTLSSAKDAVLALGQGRYIQIENDLDNAWKQRVSEIMYPLFITNDAPIKIRFFQDAEKFMVEIEDEDGRMREVRK